MVLVRGGIIAITNNLTVMHKGLGSCKALIIESTSSSVGQADSAVSILGLTESVRERERENTQQATERADVQLGLLATCQHGDFHWLSLAWW